MNKYYVGVTNDVERRYNEHLSGNGSEWTKKYKPAKIEISRKVTSIFDEDITTKEMMLKHGIENVRGGSYSQIELSIATKKHLEKELRTACDVCYRCGKSGHFVMDCNYIDVSEYIDKFKIATIETLENEIYKLKSLFRNAESYEREYNKRRSLVFIDEEYILTQENLGELLQNQSNLYIKNIESYYKMFCCNDKTCIEDIIIQFCEVDSDFHKYEKTYNDYFRSNDRLDVLLEKLRQLMMIRYNRVERA